MRDFVFHGLICFTAPTFFKNTSPARSSFNNASLRVRDRDSPFFGEFLPGRTAVLFWYVGSWLTGINLFLLLLVLITPGVCINNNSNHFLTSPGLLFRGISITKMLLHEKNYLFKILKSSFRYVSVCLKSLLFYWKV